MRTVDPPPRFRWPVEVTRPIAAPAEQVWAVISMPGNLEPCHPHCAKNVPVAWPGKDARDTVVYLNGRVFERRFNRWIDGVGYDLEIGEPGGAPSFVSWRVARRGRQDCALTIRVCPHLLQRVPVSIRWIPHFVYVGPMLRKYLDSVTRGFEWYVTRGETVPRDRFGPHPWFSD